MPTYYPVVTYEDVKKGDAICIVDPYSDVSVWTVCTNDSHLLGKTLARLDKSASPPLIWLTPSMDVTLLRANQWWKV